MKTTSRIHLRSGGLTAAILAGILGTWEPGAAEELTLAASRPSLYSELYSGAEGDTLSSVTLSVRDAEGRGVAGVAIRLDSSVPGETGAVVPLKDQVVTDVRGEASVALLLDGPPGDYALFASIPGESVLPVRVPIRVLRRSWFGFLIMGVGGGLALFLYGMRLIGRGLEKAAGGKLRDYLATMTSSNPRSLIFGMISTLMVQSSSASTVLLVSFASSGLMTVSQSLGAVLGAAVGSTFTVQLIAFRISDFALLLVATGVLLTFSGGRKRRVGGVVLGFGLIFYGLQVMSEAMATLKGLPLVTQFFVETARDPIPALIAAALFTAIAQASASTIGIVLGLSFQGILSLEAAVPFVLGANVGTATTALLASFTANSDGKRVAWAHALFRLGGVLLCLPLLGPFVRLVAVLGGDLPRQIANAHTLLNVGTALIFIPALPLASRLLEVLIRQETVPPTERARPKALDPRFHEQPTLAIAGALREVLGMGQLVIDMLDDVKKALRRDDEQLAASIKSRDDQVDLLDEQITTYLTELSTEYLSRSQSDRVLGLLFITKDLELIADIVSKGLVPGLLRKKLEHDLHFSDEGFRQLLEFHDGVRESVELAVGSVATGDRDLAGRVLQKKRDLSRLERRFQLDHLARLQAGNAESRATSTVHVDAINDLKRIVTHTARIANAVLGKVHEFPRDQEAEVDDRN